MWARLQFVVAALRWQFRYDVEVALVQRPLVPGVRDVELEAAR